VAGKGAPPTAPLGVLRKESFGLWSGGAVMRPGVNGYNRIYFRVLFFTA
jgi:hypothetical protein